MDKPRARLATQQAFIDAFGLRDLFSNICSVDISLKPDLLPVVSVDYYPTQESAERLTKKFELLAVADQALPTAQQASTAEAPIDLDAMAAAAMERLTKRIDSDFFFLSERTKRQFRYLRADILSGFPNHILFEAPQS